MFEVRTVKAKSYGNFIIVICIYRLPNSSLVQFNIELETYLQMKMSLLPVNLILFVNNELDYITNSFSHSYKSHISVPTKVSEQSSTCLDPIWTNLDNAELS